MSVYADAEQVKAVYTRLFDTVATTDPDGMDSLVKAKMIVHFRMTEPRIDMWVDGRTKPVKALFVGPGVKTTLTTEMSGNTLHEMLLGTLRLTKALGSKRLAVSGSMMKALKLEDLFHTCQSQYPSIAKEMLGQ